MMPINEQGYPSLTRGGAAIPSTGFTSPSAAAAAGGYPLPPAGHRGSGRRSSMKKQRHRSEQAQAGAGYFIRLANSSPMIKNNRSVSQPHAFTQSRTPALTHARTHSLTL